MKKNNKKTQRCKKQKMTILDLKVENLLIKHRMSVKLIEFLECGVNLASTLKDDRTVFKIVQD